MRTISAEPCGWLPLPGRVPAAKVRESVSSGAARELDATRVSSDPARRVLRALADHAELSDLLSLAGFGGGMHALYSTNGLAPALAALLAVDVASVAVVTSEDAQGDEARLRWSTHSRAAALTFVGVGTDQRSPAGGWDGVLLDGPAHPNTLLGLRSAARPGGVVAFDVRPSAPDTTYAWDRSFQARVNEGLSTWAPIAPAPPSAVMARQALASVGGWSGSAVRTVVADRLGPLADIDRELVTQRYALADGGVLHRLLGVDDRATLSRLYDPAGPEYLLDRDDLHVTRLRSLAWGRLPGS